MAVLLLWGLTSLFAVIAMIVPSLSNAAQKIVVIGALALGALLFVGFMRSANE